MREILDEYGEVIIGSLAAILILGIGYIIFNNGSLLYEFFTNIANASI